LWTEPENENDVSVSLLHYYFFLVDLIEKRGNGGQKSGKRVGAGNG
jgi:hypothetical protein